MFNVNYLYAHQQEKDIRGKDAESQRKEKEEVVSIVKKRKNFYCPLHINAKDAGLPVSTLLYLLIQS